MTKFIFLNSHPIQYYAPLYKELSSSKKIKIQVWYCCKHGLNDDIDVQFGRKIKWDIPLLDGYDYLFLKNYSLKPGINSGFFGLFNLDLINRIRKQDKNTILVIPGWNYFSYWIAFLFSIIFNKKFAFRSESPLSHEVNKSLLNKIIRKILFKYIIFKKINFAFYVGKENYNFYKNFNVDEKKLIFTPYSVDNKRFQLEFDQILKINSKAGLRSLYNVPIEMKVILFSGKFISKKRPLDVLKAFQQIENKNTFLIFMGDGELKNKMIEFINNFNLENRVFITGFINQSEISYFYSIADVFIMASSFGETWGLSVNEAMNFKLPLLVSNLTGCSSDLVVENKNGYTFESDNIHDLVKKINLILNLNNEDLNNFGNMSRYIVESYSFQTILKNLENIKL